MREPVEFIVNNKTISVISSDIRYEKVDAIVNAAKSSLLGGGGVDGAIHSSAGPELLEACRELGGCKQGNAKITPGFNLIAKYIIHTVGPKYKDGSYGENDILASAYQSSLDIANEYSLKSIAFPSISTGHYHFPFTEAGEIAIKTVIEHLKGDTSLLLVRFVLYGRDFAQTYVNILRSILS